MHAIWDTQIPEAIAGSSSLSGAKTWASTLTTGKFTLKLQMWYCGGRTSLLTVRLNHTTTIQTGTYKSSAAGWVSGLNIKDAVTTSLKWATESNAAVCSTVLAKGISYVESNDLSGAYTTTASPVVKLQIAKQGYRCVSRCSATIRPAKD